LIELLPGALGAFLLGLQTNTLTELLISLVGMTLCLVAWSALVIA